MEGDGEGSVVVWGEADAEGGVAGLWEVGEGLAVDGDGGVLAEGVEVEHEPLLVGCDGELPGEGGGAVGRGLGVPVGREGSEWGGVVEECGEFESGGVGEVGLVGEGGGGAEGGEVASEGLEAVCGVEGVLESFGGVERLVEEPLGVEASLGVFECEAESVGEQSLLGGERVLGDDEEELFAEVSELLVVGVSGVEPCPVEEELSEGLFAEGPVGVLDGGE